MQAFTVRTLLSPGTGQSTGDSREHEAELRASGVVRLRLFWSVARDEANEGSE